MLAKNSFASIISLSRSALPYTKTRVSPAIERRTERKGTERFETIKSRLQLAVARTRAMVHCT